MQNGLNQLLRFALLSLLTGLTFIAPVSAQVRETALDRYIAKPDQVYGWKLVKS